MTPEPPASLPFAEALERLCDQDLVGDFLKADQLLLEADQLAKRLKNRRTGTGTGATTLNGNELPREGGSVSAEIGLADNGFALWCDLTNKESDLWDDLAARVRHGEFHLRGRPAAAGTSAASGVMWRTTTHSATFKARTNTVEVAGESYEDVCAVLGPALSASEAERRRLPLPQAVSRWCSPWLLLNIRRIEAYLSVDEIVSLGHSRLGADGQRRRPHLGLEDWQEREWQETLKRNLQNRWADLITDLRTRIASEEIHLYGVQTSPNLTRERELIPATWAFDLEFNFDAMSVAAHGHRWTAVDCWLDPPSVNAQPSGHVAVEPATAVSCSTLAPENIPDFSDEFILALLEEHHRRVITSPDATLFPPGKISFIPIVTRMMEARAARGDLLPELASEALWLEGWIKEKAPSHQTPTAGTIENNLRSTYRRLNPRSKATI